MFELGSRKLQFVNGSLLLTLPKPWIAHQHLAKGDKVYCLLNADGDLVIMSANSDKKNPSGNVKE